MKQTTHRVLGTDIVEELFETMASTTDNTWRNGWGALQENKDLHSDLCSKYLHHFEEVAEALRKLKDIERQRKIIEEAAPIDMLPLIKEVEQFPVVERAVFRDGTVLVLTTDLTARCNGDNPIKICPHIIQLSLVSSKVKFIPLGDIWMGHSETPQGHPHCCYDDLNACLGSYASVLLEHIRLDKFVDAIETCLTFLQTYDNTDPAGAMWRNWPSGEADTVEVAA